MASETSRESIPDHEYKSTANNLNLLINQIRAKRVDPAFALKQLNHTIELIERIQEQQRTQHFSHRFEALYRVSQVLGTSLDVNEASEQAMDAVIELTGAERGFIMLRNDDGELKIQIERNFNQSDMSEDYKFSRTIAYGVLDSNKPILSTNAQEDFDADSIVTNALRSIMATPLRIMGRTVGVAYVENRAVEGMFSNEDLIMLDALSTQIGIAIDNAMSYQRTDQELARRIDQLRQLRRIDLRLSATLESEKIISDTLSSAIRMVDANYGAFITQADHSAWEIRDQSGSTDRDLQEILNDQVLLKIVQESQKPFQIHKNSEHILMSPIYVQKMNLGLLILIKQEGDGFKTDEEEMIERILIRSAQAFQNSQLYNKLQVADKAKTDFIGLVAHELNAPMTNISGYADLIMMKWEQELPQQIIGYVNDIRATVFRMTYLVKDLADISRIESGMLFMEPRHISSHTILNDITQTIVPHHKQEHQQFITDIDEYLPDIYVDYFRLHQVLTNLLSNAFKYTPIDGTITLRAKLEHEYIRFTVEDNGIGLNAAQIAMLGNKFWRSEDTFTRSKPGSGLGFSIASQLIRLMGDAITIQSEVNQGSRFSFRIPVYDDQD